MAAVIKNCPVTSGRFQLFEMVPIVIKREIVKFNSNEHGKHVNNVSFLSDRMYTITLALTS